MTRTARTARTVGGLRLTGVIGIVCCVVGWLSVERGAALGADVPVGPGGPGGPAAGSAAPKDLYQQDYDGYVPHFVILLENRQKVRSTLDRSGRHFGEIGWGSVTEEEMKISQEPGFFTLAVIAEGDRSIALIRAAVEKEGQGRHREAIRIYQQVLEQYPSDLARVSAYGVFVSVTQYAQRRLLLLPAADLIYYRMAYDGRARDAYEQARRKNSLLGLSDIVDHMMATSYGGPAMVELGNTALDRGNYTEALEWYRTVRNDFSDNALRTADLGLKMAYCRKKLGLPPQAEKEPDTAASGLAKEHLAELERLTASAGADQLTCLAQRASGAYETGDDYAAYPPPNDPMALTPPVWRRRLDERDPVWLTWTSYHPTVTKHSIIYRKRNIVYCRSILNGELRWKNDLGGPVRWQDYLQYPDETVVVQDGLVFTAMHKIGPSLVALDEATGQLRWAHGPMMAATEEEAKMRFEAPPALGPQTVYAGYVLDNIEGRTHIDTEYGVVAYECQTGRMLWRRELCRMAPGRFVTGFAVSYRNRIRSFSTPPLYHEGTVYHCTNSGAIAALDALSGRIKWLSRYRYRIGIHDATVPYGELYGWTDNYAMPPVNPMLWFQQRPLAIGEKVFFLPLDSLYMLCMDRRTGKNIWCRPKGTKLPHLWSYNENPNDDYVDVNIGLWEGSGFAYFLGQAPTGELVMVHDDGCALGSSHRLPKGGAVVLINPDTGKTVWASPATVEIDDSPVMNPCYVREDRHGMNYNHSYFTTESRPFMTTDGRLFVTAAAPVGIGFGWLTSPDRYGTAYYLCEISLKDRKILSRRRCLDGTILGAANQLINEALPIATNDLEKRLAELSPSAPGRDEFKKWIEVNRKVMASRPPVNEHGPFVAFSRMTLRRYGADMELRWARDRIEMVFDREKLRAELQGKDDPESRFALAELTLSDGRLQQAGGLMRECLDRAPAEDLDFRETVNQQLYQVHRELAWSAISGGRLEDERRSVEGMSRTVTSAAAEMESLFAMADACERRGAWSQAGQCLRSLARVYGEQEYPVAPAALGDVKQRLDAARASVRKAADYARAPMFHEELTGSAALLEAGLAAYFQSTVAPLPRPLMVRAGELAARRLVELQANNKEFAAAFAALAETELKGRSEEEQVARLWEFPGTPAAQAVLDELAAQALNGKGSGNLNRMRRLTDAARVCALRLPDRLRARMAPPPEEAKPAPIRLPAQERRKDLAGAEDVSWLVLPRRGDRANHPNLLFLAGYVRKRLDTKFLLTCMDLDTGETKWNGRGNRGGAWSDELRLRGKGQEPGFFEAVVWRDLIVVHGLYDVLAFGLDDGKVRWRYVTPEGFEIEHALSGGDMLTLAGRSETLALYLGTEHPNGELVWQVKETGDLYAAPYLVGDRLIAVRKMPFNVTVRYLATGSLIGRLDLPSLSLNDTHPLLDGGAKELPVAHDGDLLLVTDSWYYVAVDTKNLRVLWKRLIDQNDPTVEPALRFTLGGDFFLVLKKDYDQKTVYMLSSRTGEVLWRTDPKDASTPCPIYASVIAGDKVYGIAPHEGQGYYVVGMQCATGKRLFRTAVTGYGSAPDVETIPELMGNHLVLRVRDRQDMEVSVIDVEKGAPVHGVRISGKGPFGVHGCASAEAQHGRVILLSQKKLAM